MKTTKTTMNATYRKIIPRFAIAALLTAAAVCPVRADYPSTVQSHNPVGYWRFDETVPSPPLNIITNGTALGSAGTGYCVADATKGQPGVVGNCVRFNNPGDAIPYYGSLIDVTWNAALNPNPPFSIEFWAKPNSLGADSTGLCPLSNFDPNFSGASRAGWLFYLNGAGTWQFRLGNRGGYAGIITAGSRNASPGTWQHIVATWDGATVNLYINGALVGSGAASVSSWVNNPQAPLVFGNNCLTGENAIATFYSASDVTGNRGYDGWLDEVAIYPSVLSATKVNAHYSAAAPGTGTNISGYSAQILGDHPVAYWPLNDASVTAPTSFPVAANSGSLGSDANGTNYWGSLAAQSGPGYAGFSGDKAVFFDGANGYCQINNSAGLHFTNGVTTVTLAAWVKPAEEDYFRDIISQGNYSPATGVDPETFLRISRGIGPDFTGDGNYYEMGGTDGATYNDSVLFPIPPGDIGNWVFLAGTFDGASWNLYRNGELLGSALASSGDNGVFDVTNAWCIGSRSADQYLPGDGMLFGGTIAEPAIFTNVLSGTDIYNLYNAAQVPPVITRAPANPAGPVYDNNPVTFSVWAEGSPTLGWQWYKNGTGIPGQTATNFSIASATTSDSGTYSVIITNGYGSATGAVSFAVAHSLPIITNGPFPVVRYVGFPYSFSVIAIGSFPISYQWRTNGVILPGATSATYSNVSQLSFAGGFDCVLSNAFGVITSAVASFTPVPIPGGYPGLVITNGPIAYYRLDETNGTVCHDRIGGNDGAYFSATLGVPGYSILDPDPAVSFNGLNSYVGNISGTAINFTGHTNFSLEAWVNAPAGLSDQATIIAKGIGNNGTTETEQFSLDVAAGVFRFFVSRGTVTPPEIDASIGPDGTWHHVVGVYDDLNALGGGTNMYFYVDGILQGSVHTLTGPGLNDTLTPVSIGSKRTGNDPNYDGTFDGTVDEVAIYNKALDAATIEAHYAAAYGSTLAPIIFFQPSPVTNFAGLDAKFTVEAAGTVPLTYQWNKGGVAIFDANNRSYTISPLAYTDAGMYSCSITNPISGTNTISVPLVVLAPPTNPPAIPGLVLHLTFDNTLADSSGHTNNGTGMWISSTFVGTNVVSVTNTVSPSPSNPNFMYVPGMLGQALHYNTDAAFPSNSSTPIGTNDYFVTLGVRPDLQTLGSSVNFSVAYWVQLPLGYSAGDLPFFTTAPTSEGGPGFDFAPAYGYGTASGPNPSPAPQNYGGWGLTLYNGASSGAGVRLYGDVGSINDGNFHSLVHVMNHDAGPSGTITTYLDGIVAHSTTIAGTDLNGAGSLDNGLAAIIGQDPTGKYGESSYDVPNSGVTGFNIDDLGVWKKALTPLEAASIYIAAVSNQLSYVNLPIILSIAPTNNHQVVLTWPEGSLESATNVAGPYTIIPGAVPPYVVPASATLTAYRVILR